MAGKPAPYLYFVNAPVDFLFIGGFSVLLFLLLLPYASMGRSLLVIQIAAFLTWFGNWPHFAATNYRLYHSKENIAQYPVTALLIPFLMVGAVVCSFLSPNGVAPYFVKLYLIWSPYHFSGQTMGITLIYARRSGLVVGQLERLALTGFVFGSFVFQMAVSEVSTANSAFYGVTVPSLGIPSITVTIAAGIMWVSAAVLGILLIRWCLISRRFLPPIVLLPAVTQLIWFVYGSKIPNYFEFVPFFHGVQYLLIAWAMQLKEKMDMNGIRPSKSYVLSETGRWWLGNIALGAFLFWLVPRMIVQGGHAPLFFAEPIIFAAVQIHHFFVDGVIWKLRNPKVGSPLLVNIEQFLRPSPAQPVLQAR